MTESTRDVLDRLQVDLPELNGVVGLMSGGQRQAVAVSRAAAFASKVVDPRRADRRARRPRVAAECST